MSTFDTRERIEAFRSEAIILGFAGIDPLAMDGSKRWYCVACDAGHKERDRTKPFRHRMECLWVQAKEYADSGRMVLGEEN